MFSTRSACKVQWDQWRRNRRVGDASIANRQILDEEQWRKMWGVKCPSKIKYFFWRMANNMLALWVVLNRRKMKIDNTCSMCHWCMEDGVLCYLSANM